MSRKADQITREKLELAMKSYLSKGGKIHVLPKAPDNLHPNVGGEHSVYDDMDSFNFLENLKIY